MEIHNLSLLKWELVGTKPHYWRLWEQMDEMRIKHPENAPVTARVPGSVQQSLLDKGIIPDWNMGTNYRDIEWVENRHWIYFTDIPDNFFDTNRKAVLSCNGLDGDGEVWLNGQKVGEFNNTHLDYRFDVSSFLKTSENRLALIFFCPERYQGQVYWTSKTRLNKPRFYYNWDWCPRIIQTGIWDAICIEIMEEVAIEQLYSYTDVDIETKNGKLQLKAAFSAEITNEIIKICLKDIDDVCIFNKTFPAENFCESIDFDLP